MRFSLRFFLFTFPLGWIAAAEEQYSPRVSPKRPYIFGGVVTLRASTGVEAETSVGLDRVNPLPLGPSFSPPALDRGRGRRDGAGERRRRRAPHFNAPTARAPTASRLDLAASPASPPSALLPLRAAPPAAAVNTTLPSRPPLSTNCR